MTRLLRDARRDIADRVRTAGCVWVGTDFDGTLAHHHDDPLAVELRAETRLALAVLADHPAAAVAVISGRGLVDIKARVALTTVAYAGNHGLEIEAPGLCDRDAAAIAARPALAAVVARLQHIAGVAGVHVQDKGLTLAIDYRGLGLPVRREVVASVDVAVRSVEGIVARHSPLGSEVRPVRVGDKGTAAFRLWHHQIGRHAVPVFLGDDFTDEDAFAAMVGAVTVKVGDGPTLAAYRAADPDEVRDFLHWLTATLG